MLKKAVLLCVLFAAPMLRADAVSLTLSPTDGAVAGKPGDTVGWGFTINSTYPAYWLVVTSADFCVGPISSPCSNSVGTFTDYIAQFNFIIVGPFPESPTVSQPFDMSAMTGVGSFAINPSAKPGKISGLIVLTYDLYSVDPNDPSFDPGSDTVSVGNQLTARASVTVVPEPASLFLLGSGMFCLGRATRRKLRPPC